MIYIGQLAIVIFLVWSAITQGGKHETKNKKLTTRQRDAWHRNNFLLYCAVCIAVIFISGYKENWWKLIAASFVIRVAFFDYFYDKAAGLDPKYIGDGREFLEGVEVRIFGQYGGIKKMILSFLLLIILNLLNYFLK